MSKPPLGVSLDWQGGFQIEDALPDTPGLYALTSRRYGDQRILLYYVGCASARGLRTRWRDRGYPAWLSRLVMLFDGEIHYSIPKELNSGNDVDAQTIEDIELTLIWLHLPPANSKGINMGFKTGDKVTLNKHLHITNTGSIKQYLLSEIDTRKDWKGLRSPFNA